MTEVFIEAMATRDLAEFMRIVFPPSWRGIAARILESGATFSDELCDWAPRWSKIPPTVRLGKSEVETAIKSCMFRAHDCIHQLWGLPLPSPLLDENDFYIYKRSQMCGEMAVLTLTEFDLAYHWYVKRPDLQPIFEARNAIPMLLCALDGKSTIEIAQRLDGLLHKGQRPRWVREHPASTRFVDDYVPMLEFDRVNIDHNWGLMRAANWRPVTAPNSRYNPNMDGLELTQWMINDFFHLQGTDAAVDEPLRDFNRARREGIVLPSGWNGANR